MPAEKIKDRSNTYTEGVGRRKTATARVRLFSGKDGEVVINDKPLIEYFPTNELQTIVLSPFAKTEKKKAFRVTVKVSGGGIHSQAEAVRHGVSRALVAQEEGLRGVLKPEKYLTRDARMKERRKFGLKKARRAPQWSKR